MATRQRRGSRPFVVDVSQLRRSPGSALRLEVKGALDELEVSGSSISSEQEISFDGIAESVHEGILVTGTVRAVWHGSCRRCLEDTTGAVVGEVQELFVSYPDADDETTYRLDGDELDLALVVHDACILELPLAPLCREDCLGFCPECGANRNLEPCSCLPKLDPRWEVLRLVEREARHDHDGETGQARRAR